MMGASQRAPLRYTSRKARNPRIALWAPRLTALPVSLRRSHYGGTKTLLRGVDIFLAGIYHTSFSPAYLRTSPTGRTCSVPGLLRLGAFRSCMPCSFAGHFGLDASPRGNLRVSSMGMGMYTFTNMTTKSAARAPCDKDTSPCVLPTFTLRARTKK